MSRPACFDGTQDGSHEEWRFQLVAYPTGVDPSFADVADKVARRTTPYQLADIRPEEEEKKASLMLHSVIVGCVKNRPLRLIMAMTSRDGREALRKLDAEYKPTYRGRRMALLKRIMHPNLNSAVSDTEYMDKLSEWQQLVREYERICGQVDQELESTSGSVAKSWTRSWIRP